MSKIFKVGQRWISQSEPELGLGTINQVEHKRVTVFFEGTDETRVYGKQAAPLERARFSQSDQVSVTNEELAQVLEVREESNLIYYKIKNSAGVEKELVETLLYGAVSATGPEDRLSQGRPDIPSLFDLRIDTLMNQIKVNISSARGLLGGRVALLPHQFYIATEGASRSQPRLLLADEVGLGKTIEAGLILHQMLVSEKIGRVLILVPSTLIHQWFLEMLRKFNLTFGLMSGILGGIPTSELDDRNEPTPEIPAEIISQETFNQKQLWILSKEELLESPHAEKIQNGILSTSWDMVLVDEAHALEWKDATPGPYYLFVSELTSPHRSPNTGLILLTATPEQLGEEGHFARLKLLDPDRFPRFSDYKKEEKEYSTLVQSANLLISGDPISGSASKLIAEKLGVSSKEISGEMSSELRLKYCRQLIDRWGTGRIYFRNTRSQMEKDYDFFPERIPVACPLADKERTAWLLDLIKSLKKEKILLICSQPEKVYELELFLKEHRVTTGVFHEGQNLIERDRQAAYFADADGAQILLCSEIGSEGRNFQFAHHLVMYDLPTDPDLLEQRIGRLDRIGQKNAVTIYVPYRSGSEGEVWFRFYHESLNAFSKTCKSASSLVLEFEKDLLAWEKLSDKFFEKARKRAHELDLHLEAGRNRLLEVNSFDREKAEKIVKEVENHSDSVSLRNFMENVFQHTGVVSEELDDNSDHIHAGTHMWVESFPCLPESKEEGLTVTYDRKTALVREDFEFLTWDHPMVTGVIDMILGQGIGNSSVGSWKSGLNQEDEAGKNPLFLETVFCLEPIAPKNLQPSQFFPSTPIRVLLSQSGKDESKNWPVDKLNGRIRKPSRRKLSVMGNIPQKFIKEKIKAAEQIAEKSAVEIRDQAIEKMTRELEGELERLEFLSRVNSLVKDSEIVQLREKKRQLTNAYVSSQVRLDCVRLIF